MDARDYFVREHRKALEQAKELNEKSEPDDEQAQALIQNLLGKANEFKAEIEALDRKEEQRQAIEEMAGPHVPEPEVTSTKGMSLGELFVKSEGYQRVKAGGVGGASGWTTGDINIPDYFTKTLMDETASAGALTPQIVPGIRLLPQTRLTVANLMPNNTTDNPSIKYFVETTATNAAAATAEGVAKPEGSFVLDDVDEPLRKIAVSQQITDELLEDVSGIQSYLNSRLSYFVQATEELELVSGSGTAPHIAGFLDDSRNLPTGSALSLDADSVMDAVLMAITKIRVDGEAEPDGIVINPYDYFALRTMKDTAKQYYAGGPFQNQYGNGQIPGGNPGPDIWGLNTVVTPSIAQGTVLLGAFQAHSAVWRKGGLSVAASNSHGTNFTENKTTIRAEERLGLAVYRRQAFYVITSLSGLIS